MIFLGFSVQINSATQSLIAVLSSVVYSKIYHFCHLIGQSVGSDALTIIQLEMTVFYFAEGQNPPPSAFVHKIGWYFNICNTTFI